jgi:ubiquinone/menaquinone biosynthesis C-methylase UbiE
VPDNYFDKVVASASFHHFLDKDKALEEMRRVLKPDGKIIILENASSFMRLYFILEPNYINHHS